MIGLAKRLLLSLGLVCAFMACAIAADPAPQLFEDVEKSPGKEPVSVDRTVRIGSADYRLTGPFKHDNLGVYLIHAKAEMRIDKEFMTLDEGLRSGKVIVKEKKGGGSVQELLIENRGDLPLYLQEGDRLSGGQQDRTVQSPLVIAPRSGPQALPTYCIEQSRWHAATPESRFAATTNVATAPRSVRQAAKFQRDQGAVWNNVKSKKDEYAKSLMSSNTNSSLNESLDSESARKAAAAYTGPLSKIVAGQKDVVGVAFAVNGRIEEVNVYAGHPLLAKMLPRLLESYAMEAAAAKARPVETVDEKGGAVADAAMAKTEAETTAKLKKALNTKYNGMTFVEVLSDLATATGVAIEPDWAAIEQAGIAKDKRIVVRVRNTPGDDVLRQVLEFASVRAKEKLGFAVVGGRVHVTGQKGIGTLAAAQRKKQEVPTVTAPPRTMEIGPLVPPPNLDAMAAFMEAAGPMPLIDRRIDGANTLQVAELGSQFFSRSVNEGVVVHQQWMRTEKPAAK